MSPQKIVFTGITGLLGGYFLKQRDPKYQIFGISRKNVDITDGKKVLAFIKKIKPQVLVHAASLGNVDYCERNPNEAYKVNVVGVANIIAAAKKVNSKIIFLSSNAVYDGVNPPFNEKSPVNPVDVYGKTKIEGEKLIKNSGLNHVIVRLITMYGWPQAGGRANPVSWMIESLQKGQNLTIVNDIYNNHLWAGQAADVLWKIIKENKRGVYNIAGKDSISRYDLALRVAKIFGLESSLISPVGSDFFKNIAKRPKNTCFDTRKMEKELDIKPLGIEEGLQLMKDEVRP